MSVLVRKKDLSMILDANSVRIHRVKKCGKTTFPALHGFVPSSVFLQDESSSRISLVNPEVFLKSFDLDQAIEEPEGRVRTWVPDLAKPDSRVTTFQAVLDMGGVKGATMSLARVAQVMGSKTGPGCFERNVDNVHFVPTKAGGVVVLSWSFFFGQIFVTAAKLDSSEPWEPGTRFHSA